MANQQHLKIFKQGARIWNKWRAQHKRIRPNLSNAEIMVLDQGRTDFRGANLHGANLRDVEFVGINLHGADLRQSDLRGAYFWEVNLEASNLNDAFLGDTSFIYVNLRRASLIRMSLRNTHLFRVDLTEADCSHCFMGGTVLADIDLSVAEGLETVDHRGPSTIGMDTIYRSEGRIPEVFLHGAGVPESFISNMKAIMAAMSPLSFYSCFISYSSNDQEFATCLHVDLQSKGVRCWFAPEDLKIGDKLRGAFDEAIHVYDKLLVILSESSVKSTWVEKEVETAFDKERKQNRTVLFPIRLDDAVMETHQAWAADVRRTRHIGDFREWKNHESYKKAFERLLRDLQSETKAESAHQTL
jgi:uncharacterized protein YjbI with pentapeptide repeats